MPSTKASFKRRTEREARYERRRGSFVLPVGRRSDDGSRNLLSSRSGVARPIIQFTESAGEIEAEKKKEKERDSRKHDSRVSNRD